ncbi:MULTISPECIES: hypothetical protein [unclassified Bacteroides]|jgi:peroxiredoxin family protein|uniref:hypothetical protein n=1 Tax=unclassified Bacteroides TaxID=2646097 RepID=UPI000E8821D8|nr:MULTISPECIES: hypothetical protein [unclassified Bacteroides]RGN45361.1 hypothetical protein DXB63_12570 [Bacteroides sp. OM05-12]RHR73075.1 hypothetical protein DWW69_15200 [Bacteroides sp. AF16-49]
MKKHYLGLLSVMLCALFCSNAFAEKLAYGFCVNNLDENINPPYLCTVDVETSAAEIVDTKIQDCTVGTPVSGIYAEKDYYLLSKVNAKTGLYKVDLKGALTSYTTIVAETKLDGTYTALTAIAYDPAAKIMYATSTNALYTLNMEDGTLTKVGNMTTKCYAIACSSKGDLYGYSWKGELLTIDKTSGAQTTVMTVNEDFDGAPMNVSLFFDNENDKLYCYYADWDWYDYLVEIDLENKTVSNKKHSQNDTQIVGLSFQTTQVQPIEPEGVRTAYGIHYSADVTEIVSFNANDVTEGTTHVADYSLKGTPHAATYGKNAYYVVGQGDDNKTHLYKTDDMTNGSEYTQVGDATIELLVKDMAYNPYDNVIYAIADSSRVSENSILYTVDLTTGAFVRKQYCIGKYIALAALKNGQLYGITTEGKFNKLYATSGQGKNVGSVDINTFSTNFPCDLEFDLSTLKLYWSYQNEGKNGTESYLAEIDAATGKILSQKAYKDKEAVIGLYFPEKTVEPSATWYGYCYANDNILDGETGKNESFVSFDPENLASISLLPTTLSGVGSGTYGEGGLYTFGIRSNGYGADPTSLNLIDVATWTSTKIADIPSGVPVMWDMTYDYSGSMIYAVSFEGDPDPNMVGSLINTYSSLFSFNPATKEWTKIGRLNKDYRGIACSLRGELYGMTTDKHLCKINKITAAEEVYMTTDILVEETLQASLEFDHGTETLYMTYFAKAVPAEKRVSNAYLAKFNLEEKTITQKTFLGLDKICALYIPFERDPNIPAKVSDFTVTPGRYGDLLATLKWTNPTKTLGGDALGAITSIEIIRNGETIHTVTEAAELASGAKVTYEDETPTNGFNNYVVNVINEAGVGEVSSKLVFVGQDQPSAPQEVKLTVENGTKAILTWKAPTTGANTGWLNPNGLSYKITRQPDNFVVAEQTTLYTFTENIDVLNYYYYEITANNAQGTSEAAKSNSVVIGTAMAVPYECDFMSDGDLGLWTTEGTWTITGLGIDGESRGLHHAYNGPLADDWAYSPAILLSGDKTYKLKFDARSVVGTGKESMMVRAGTDKTFEAQTIMIIDLPSVGGTPTALEGYEANFKVPADGKYYLGFYCYSSEDVDAEKFTYELQVSNVKLNETTPDNIDLNSMDDTTVYAIDGKIYINGEYTSATVYNQLGAVCSTNATLATGIYFVKVMNGNASKTYKVFIK